MKFKILPLLGAIVIGACADINPPPSTQSPLPATQSPPPVTQAPPPPTKGPPPGFVGWSTNGPVVYVNSRGPATNQTTNLVADVTNRVFDHFLPESLNQFVWTNFIAHTNGRSTALWSERSHPPGWLTNKTAPTLVWNTNSLLWGMKGMTAISQCWEGEGYDGQVPITALTRRHGYTRGHGMAPEGVSTNWTGKKVWFATAGNQRVEATLGRAIISMNLGDYTIFLFRQDLPPGIEPLRVVDVMEVWTRYPARAGAPRPLCETEQTGHVNAGIAGFTVPAWKGGDSGSPDMLPFGDELVSFGGRRPSAPTPKMQADMDKLCLLEGLDPRKYQLQWVDLSRFPVYPIR